uniref:Uncharacterized protein n=1 Tax=uncultured Desulfobacterium sp. TaxID=201089 RepID=E1YLB9_9BACT|nr:unknown protein [uncultured Desulfobacterium sp.]
MSEYEMIPEKTGVFLKGMAISKIKKITDQLLKSETM